MLPSELVWHLRHLRRPSIGNNLLSACLYILVQQQYDGMRASARQAGDSTNRNCLCNLFTWFNWLRWQYDSDDERSADHHVYTYTLYTIQHMAIFHKSDVNERIVIIKCYLHEFSVSVFSTLPLYLFNINIWIYLILHLFCFIIVCFCLSDLTHGSRPYTEFLCSSVFVLVQFFSWL